MQFWHIPWPSWDVFRSCPEHDELLDGLLANDLLGFHTDRYCRNFLDCVSQAFDAEVNHETGLIRYEGRTIRVEAFPLGIDAVERRRLAGSSEADEAWESLRESYPLTADRLAVGVDRLDYTKGIEQRLTALERLWEKYPEWRETFTYVQKASESRSQIEDYQRVKENVTGEVERINERFGTETWTPIVYIDDQLPLAALAALYRESDMVLVSSLRDGMNLVAKEFVASQVDEPGVLVLSELVGAHEELGEWSLTVHPNDTEAFADSIKRALEMEEPERANRMSRLQASVEKNDIETWKNNVLRSASEVLSRKETEGPVRRIGRDDGTNRRMSDEPNRLPRIGTHLDVLRSRLRTADNLFVFLDFDGTLAPIADDPDEVELPEWTKIRLQRLASTAEIHVAIISGRSLSDVRDHVGVDGIGYAGNHGLQLFVEGGTTRRIGCGILTGDDTGDSRDARRPTGRYRRRVRGGQRGDGDGPLPAGLGGHRGRSQEYRRRRGGGRRRQDDERQAGGGGSAGRRMGQGNGARMVPRPMRVGRERSMLAVRRGRRNRRRRVHLAGRGGPRNQSGASKGYGDGRGNERIVSTTRYIRDVPTARVAP